MRTFHAFKNHDINIKVLKSDSGTWYVHVTCYRLSLRQYLAANSQADALQLAYILLYPIGKQVA